MADRESFLTRRVDLRMKMTNSAQWYSLIPFLFFLIFTLPFQLNYAPFVGRGPAGDTTDTEEYAGDRFVTSSDESSRDSDESRDTVRGLSTTRVRVNPISMCPLTSNTAVAAEQLLVRRVQFN